MVVTLHDRIFVENLFQVGSVAWLRTSKVLRIRIYDLGRRMRSIRIQCQCRARKNVIGRPLNRTEMGIETINTKMLVRWVRSLFFHF